MSFDTTNMEPPMAPLDSALKIGVGTMLWRYDIVISTCYVTILLGGAMSSRGRCEVCFVSPPPRLLHVIRPVTEKKCVLAAHVFFEWSHQRWTQRLTRCVVIRCGMVPWWLKKHISVEHLLFVLNRSLTWSNRFGMRHKNNNSRI